MSLAQFVFSEATPASHTTLVSSNPVSGDNSFGMPAGVAGRLDDYSAVRFTADIPPNTTGATVDVTLQTSADGTNWYEQIRIPQIANGAPAVSYMANLSLSTATSTTVQVGKGAAPVLGANIIINGAFASMARLLMSAGAGVSSSINIVVSLTAQRSRLREAGGS